MRQQITVYLEDDNRHWLRSESKRTGVGMSGLVNMFVAEQRRADKDYVGEVIRSLETARLADEEISQLIDERLDKATQQAYELNEKYNKS